MSFIVLILTDRSTRASAELDRLRFQLEHLFPLPALRFSQTIKSSVLADLLLHSRVLLSIESTKLERSISPLGASGSSSRRSHPEVEPTERPEWPFNPMVRSLPPGAPGFRVRTTTWPWRVTFQPESWTRASGVEVKPWFRCWMTTSVAKS